MLQPAFLRPSLPSSIPVPHQYNLAQPCFQYDTGSSPIHTEALSQPTWNWTLPRSRQEQTSGSMASFLPTHTTHHGPALRLGLLG